MNEQNNEALLSELCSNLKEELVNVRQRTSQEIESLKQKITELEGGYLKTPLYRLHLEQQSAARKTAKQLTEKIEELRSELSHFKTSSIPPEVAEKQLARIALLEKANKRQKAKVHKRETTILEQQREIADLTFLLRLSHLPEEERTARYHAISNAEEGDTELVTTWKEAFATMRKHYDEAVALASNILREHAPELWQPGGNSADSDD